MVCCCSVAQSCLTLCDPMDCSTPGFPVFHYLPEFAQPHVHWIGDAIQPSHPPVIRFSSCSQSFPASGSFPVSRLFASGSQSIGASASVHAMNIQGWFPLGLTGLITAPLQWLNFMCQLCWAMVPSCLVKHQSRYCCKSSFEIWLAYIVSRLWVKKLLSIMWMALVQSARPKTDFPQARGDSPQ